MRTQKEVRDYFIQGFILIGIIIGTVFIFYELSSRTEDTHTYTIESNNGVIVCNKGYYDRCGYYLSDCSDNKEHRCSTNVIIERVK